MTEPRSYTKPVLIGFLLLTNAVWMTLAVALIWTNATKPVSLIESCTAVEIKRAP